MGTLRTSPKLGFRLTADLQTWLPKDASLRLCDMPAAPREEPSGGANYVFQWLW